MELFPFRDPLTGNCARCHVGVITADRLPCGTRNRVAALIAGDLGLLQVKTLARLRDYGPPAGIA
jgi:hypothetical protein